MDAVINSGQLGLYIDEFMTKLEYCMGILRIYGLTEINAKQLNNSDIWIQIFMRYSIQIIKYIYNVITINLA